MPLNLSLDGNTKELFYGVAQAAHANGGALPMVQTNNWANTKPSDKADPGGAMDRLHAMGLTETFTTEDGSKWIRLTESGTAAAIEFGWHF